VGEEEDGAGECGVGVGVGAGVEGVMGARGLGEVGDAEEGDLVVEAVVQEGA